ncbi:hypothetical protein TcG_12766 [Trypanosoma cruzi]|uniref:Uncharacterized protein n=1 Tax=Trypanosoma cruzi Dm28c TaxID=1416333 RepID=V5A3R8_TRYCR|nr:hypothetical protein TCDM_13112 [Trypanosoma cruzi Dm28c]RNE97002.1 hypothetical protein TcG_12766 [Trypanosoma cruzi]
MRVFPSGSICAPGPLGCVVRIDVKVPASRFIAFPAVAAAAAFLRSCGFLTRCFGEGVAALIVHCILILVSRSGDIEREGLLPSCFICPLCLTASCTQACSSTPQLVLAGLLTVLTGSRMRQLFSAPFQCRILLIDGRHSVRRATLIGLCGTARRRHRRKPADFFTYLNVILRAVVFFTCSVEHSNSEESGTMRAWNSSCHVNRGQHRGAATLTPQSCCVSLQGWQGNSMQPATAGVSSNAVTPCE